MNLARGRFMSKRHSPLAEVAHDGSDCESRQKGPTNRQAFSIGKGGVDGLQRLGTNAPMRRGWGRDNMPGAL